MRILATSDHHTLHQTTPTHHILGNMSQFFYKENDLKEVDLVLFGGDLMDKLVESPNPDLFKVKEWFKEFTDYCNSVKTKILLLEGTFYHEWGQPRHLVTVAPTGFDYRYVDTIKVEFYPELDNLSILCVPDNLKGMTPEDVWDAALDVLKQNKLGGVDIVLFHQAFHDQLPTKMRDKTHDQSRWESICEYLILSGHIHTPSIVGKRHCMGSFDRISHGEEHPKGAYVVDLDKTNKTFNVTFWENKKALPYVTLKVEEDIKAEELVSALREFIRKKNLPPFSQIRVKGGSADIVTPIIRIFEKEYTQYGFKAKNIKSADELVEEEVYSTGTYTGVSIVKENISTLLAKEAEADFAELGISMEEALSVLEGFK